MTFTVEFADTAKGDLFNILDFIAADNPRRALSFVDELESHIRKRLEVFPGSGSPIGNHRYVVFRGYVAVYSVDEKSRRVLVMLVAEGHKDWRSAFE